MRVRFVLDDEDDVSGNGVGRLVAFPWECDLCPLLPASLDLNGEDLILRSHGPAVWVQPFAGDFHSLGAAVEDFFQGDPQFMHDGGVLLPTLLPAKAHVAVPREAVHVEAGEGAKGVVPIHIHVLVVSSVGFAPKEHLERVGATKKSGKGGMRVSMEGVGEVGALSIASRSTSTLQT